jgi:chemotaxis protein methyltransferase CheR
MMNKNSAKPLPFSAEAFKNLTASLTASSSFSSPKMSDREFAEWRQYVYQLCGIYFQDNKQYLLESRLQKRMSFLGIESYKKYLDYVRNNRGAEDERKFLFEVITINETFFFRNQPQLDVLVQSVAPEILKNKIGDKRLRIWSAACSSGEEAYSTAVVIDELLKPKHPGLKYEIVGTDINYKVIDTAKRGVYRDYSVRNTPPYYLKKYFRMENGEYILAPSMKENVEFKVLNLYDDAAMRAMSGFDVIFCANVLIYFDMRSKIKVVSHLYNSLNKGGYLFIGYSETLQSISKAFKLVSFPKTIGYKKE